MARFGPGKCQNGPDRPKHCASQNGPDWPRYLWEWFWLSQVLWVRPALLDPGMSQNCPPEASLHPQSVTARLKLYNSKAPQNTGFRLDWDASQGLILPPLSSPLSGFSGNQKWILIGRRKRRLFSPWKPWKSFLHLMKNLKSQSCFHNSMVFCKTELLVHEREGSLECHPKKKLGILKQSQNNLFCLSVMSLTDCLPA